MRSEGYSTLLILLLIVQPFYCSFCNHSTAHSAAILLLILQLILYRTFSIYIVTGGVQGAYALVRGGSNLVEPSRTTSFQR